MSSTIMDFSSFINSFLWYNGQVQNIEFFGLFLL